jgi:hypothetical protein
MPNFAIIENGKVANVAVAELSYAEIKGWIILPEGVGIGWDFDGQNFIDTTPIPEVLVIPSPTKEELLAKLQILQTQIQELNL